MRIKLAPTFWRHRFCVPFSDDVAPSSLFLKFPYYLVFDIETLRTFQEVGGEKRFDALGVSVACAFDSKTGKYLTYLEKDLPKLFELCYERLIVGYNIRGFDIPVLASYGMKTDRLESFDIMYDIENLTRQRFIKLDLVAQGTLGKGKSADGLQAIEWWRKGEHQKVIDYCLQDVEVTKDIFEFGRKNGFVKIQRAEGEAKRVPVQWN